MGDEAYEKYMGVKNKTINQALVDCYNEIKRLIDFCTVEHDYVPTCVYDIFEPTHTIKLRSMKFDHVIAINFPLYSSETVIYKYLARQTYKEYKDEYIKEVDKKKAKPLLDEGGRRIYAFGIIPY